MEPTTRVRVFIPVTQTIRIFGFYFVWTFGTTPVAGLVS